MIIYLDTETTGLYPGNICQLSYIIQEKTGVRAKNFFFTVDYVEPGAQAVHGFSKEKLYELSGGKRFKDFFDEIDKDLRTADLIITHNVAFDFMFLRKEYESIGEEFCFKESLCSMKKTVQICKLRRMHHVGYKYPKLSEMAEHFGIGEDAVRKETKLLFGSENAFHDARFDTATVYLAMEKARKTEESLKIIDSYLL